jgi:hypothetical protein
MNISVNWVDGMLMVGKSHSGHSITMDGPPEDRWGQSWGQANGNAVTGCCWLHYD